VPSINLSGHLKDAVRSVAEKSMDGVANELRESGKADEVAISVDDSWQRRGFTSTLGVVTAISVDKGKVLDCSIMSKFFPGFTIAVLKVLTPGVSSIKTSKMEQTFSKRNTFLMLMSVKHSYRFIMICVVMKCCLHGKTQNANESYNGMIWNRVPKHTHVGLQNFSFGVYDAIAHFNYGQKATIDVFSYVNIDPGTYTTRGCTTVQLTVTESDNEHINCWRVPKRDVKF